jgi:hypothetical protein
VALAHGRFGTTAALSQGRLHLEHHRGSFLQVDFFAHGIKRVATRLHI